MSGIQEVILGCTGDTDLWNTQYIIIGSTHTDKIADRMSTEWKSKKHQLTVNFEEYLEAGQGKLRQ